MENPWPSRRLECSLESWDALLLLASDDSPAADTAPSDARLDLPTECAAECAAAGIEPSEL